MPEGAPTNPEEEPQQEQPVQEAAEPSSKGALESIEEFRKKKEAFDERMAESHITKGKSDNELKRDYDQLELSKARLMKERNELAEGYFNIPKDARPEDKLKIEESLDSKKAEISEQLTEIEEKRQLYVKKIPGYRQLG